MDMMYQALKSMLDPIIILLIFGGTAAGLFVGAMPGLTATMALAVLLPFTFTLPPLQGLVALGAVYMSAIYGGSFAAILVNTPGTPSSIATAFEGYPMTKQGRGLEAISVATVASAIGGIAGCLFLLFLAPPLAKLSLRFGPAEYFWVAMLGVTLISTLSEGSSLKGLLGGCFGMLVGTMGVAPIGGETRFTFGMPVLQGGIEMIVALIGLFVLPEIFSMAALGRTAIGSADVTTGRGVSFWSVTKKVFSMPGNLIRSCIIGEIIAIIPGAGGNIANLVAYNEAKRVSRQPELYGTGIIEGLVASESSNNVTVAGSMVPLLTLGIPGAPPDAVVLGVLLLHGLRPGIELFTTSGVLTYGFIISMGLAALAMIPVGLLGGRLIYKAIFKTPYYFLAPTIGLATMLGTFALRNSISDVIIMLILGTVGYLFKQIGIGAAPIVLGLILGSIAETGYVQAMLSGAAYKFPVLRLFENSLSWIIIGLVVFSAAWPYLIKLFRRLRTPGPALAKDVTK
jgi:putative tricarboxylic transport membrane protein